METLYGKYPKKITCQCNAGEIDPEAVTIPLNDRCPVCHSVRQISIAKPEIRMKAVSGITEAQTAEEPVFNAQEEIEPAVIWAQVLNDQFNRSFSYFMKLSEMYWIYTWAFLTLSPEVLQGAGNKRREPR